MNFDAVGKKDNGNSLFEGILHKKPEKVDSITTGISSASQTQLNFTPPTSKNLLLFFSYKIRVIVFFLCNRLFFTADLK